MMKRFDNQVIFIDMDGKPVCNGAREFYELNRLPKYCDLTHERVKVDGYGTRVLISIPMKINDRIPIKPENIKNCIWGEV